MQAAIPKNIITTINYTRSFDGFDVQYTISCTFMGEVISVMCPFLDLPATARKLMGSTSKTDVSLAAKGLMQAIPYAFPLIAMNRLKSKEWESVHQQLKGFQENNQFIPLEKYLQDPWVTEAYRQHWLPGPKQQLFLLAQLLKEEENARFDAIKAYQITDPLNVFDPGFVGPVLLAVLPMTQRVFTIHAIYKALATYPSAETYDALAKRLIDPEYKKYHRSILKGLQFCQQDDLDKTLHQYFFDTPLLNGDTLDAFIIASRNLPSQKRDTLLTAILTSDNRVAGIKAYEELIVIGRTDKELAEKLYPVFKERRSLENMRGILKLYARIPSADLLPTGSELINTLEWANKDNEAIAINYSLTDPLKKRLNPKGFNRLVTLLKKDNKHIREAALKQVLELAEEQDLWSITTISAEVDVSIQPKLAFLQKKILKQYSYRAPLASLLQVLAITKDLKKECLSAIKKIIAHRANPIAIDPLIQELKHPDPSIRKKVLLILRLFKEENVKKVIQEIATTDIDTSVQKTAQQAIAWIDNPLPTSLKKQQELSGKIEEYLEELIIENEKDNGKALPFLVRMTMKTFGRFYYRNFPPKEWE